MRLTGIAIETDATGQTLSGVERGLALPVFGIQLSAMFGQEFDHVVEALKCSAVQGGLAAAIGGIHVHTRVETELDRFDGVCLRFAAPGCIFFFSPDTG